VLLVIWALARLVTWLHTLEAQPLRHHLIPLLQWDLELVESPVHTPQMHRRRPRNVTSKRCLIRTLRPAPPEQIISPVRQLLHLGNRHSCHLHSLFLDLKLHIRLQTTNTRDPLHSSYIDSIDLHISELKRSVHAFSLPIYRSVPRTLVTYSCDVGLSSGLGS
jgi:hypothetical protein